MYSRILTIGNNYSFFLFGARGVGKSTLLKSHFTHQANSPLWIDLLDVTEEAIFQADPGVLLRRCDGLPPGSWVVIDEVQKVPPLLDLVHKCIESQQLLFALSGSSARKLKRGGANLLAGRAFVNELYPLGSRELGGAATIEQRMMWGGLPQVWKFDDDESRKRFLQAYVHTYLKEEIQVEQLVRNLPGFRKFLPVAAQMNGKPLNYSSIARDVLSDHTVVRNFFDILEDTFIGFRLPAYSRSVRQQQRHAAKFYLFDCGVKRALDHTLDIPLRAGTYEYGRAFEHAIILELYQQCRYRARDEQLSYLQTKDDVEIDVILERPGKPSFCLEIKSTTHVQPADYAKLARIAPDVPNSRSIVISQDPHAKRDGGVTILHWRDFLEQWLADAL